MNSIKFPAFKFHALDYVYENVMRQRVTISCMCIPFPEGIQQDETYCHSGTFANDSYRRPWTRRAVIPTCKVNLEGSLLDEWRKYSYTEDYLEKQYTTSSTFQIKGKVIDVVPSSNPSSQIDLEEIFSFAENNTVKEEHCHEECWKNGLSSIVKKTPEDYFLPEDVIFIDHLATFSQHLPKLSLLLSRLKIFPVEDPLVNWNKVLTAREPLFRIETCKETEDKPNVCTEDFHVLPLEAEESLMLPYMMELNCDPDVSRTSVSELSKLLELTPEIMPEGQMAGFHLKRVDKVELFEHQLRKKELYSSNSERLRDTASFHSYHDAEVEVPFTPPFSLFKPEENSLCVKLEAEEMSPAPHNFMITEASKDILESLICNAEIAPLFLKVPRIQNTFQNWTLSELIENISVDEELLANVTLKNNCWSELGLKVKCPYTTEPLDTNYSTANNLVSSTVESFMPIAATQFERLLEEKTSSVKENTDFQKCEQPLTSHDCSSPEIKLSCSPSQWKRNVTDLEAHDNVTDMREQNKLNISPHICNIENIRNNSTIPAEELFLSPVKPCGNNSNEIADSCGSKGTGLYSPETISKDASDPLSNFIMLRTSRFPEQTENNILQESPVKDKDAESSSSELKETVCFSPDAISEVKSDEDTERYLISINVAPSASQCQVYQILEASATPVINKLKGLDVPVCKYWTFSSVTFDHTRFLLRQQEKTVTDDCKIGKKHDREIIMFKHAALLHILVTFRDLMLTCTFDTALEYFCKAKEMYKSALGSCLDNVWRKLRVVQFVREKNEEVNPKITELQGQLLQWMDRSWREDRQFKVLILMRMEADDVQGAILDALSKMAGMKVVDLCPVKGRRFVEDKSVLHRLESCSCIVINSQHIGSAFPWAHFSLVIDYDCTDCWLPLCQDLKVPYMTLKTSLPEHLSVGENSLKGFEEILLDMQVPYVFLSSEGLLNNPDILQIMESRYNMTCIERSCSASLKLFGKTDQFAVITVDECTVIVMQNLEELKNEKSSENIILKLVALSLQYSCCWIVFHCRESSQSEYKLSADILHNLSLFYAALVPLTAKSNELEVKVFISPGVEETGFLIHKIADHTLMSCKGDPYKWLEKSWLSVLPSLDEQCLLTFPCINPMVAQLMLHRGSSLQWLLAAKKDQLQELVPEVPMKVIKHFTDITSLHQLSTSASSPRPLNMSPAHRAESCSSHYNEKIQRSPIFTHRQGKPFSDTDLTNNQWHSGADISPYRDVSSLNPTENVASNGSLKYLFSYQGENSQSTATQYNMLGQDSEYTFISNDERKKDISQTWLESKPFTMENYSPVTESAVAPVRFGLRNSRANSLSYLRHQKETIQANTFNQTKPHAPVMEILDGPAFSNEAQGFLQNVCHQPFHYVNRLNTSSPAKRERPFIDLLSQQSPKNPACYSNKLEDVIYVGQSVPIDKQWNLCSSKQRSEAFHCSHFSKASHELYDDIDFQLLTGDLVENKGLTGGKTTMAENKTPKAEIQFVHQPQVKRRKLSYEKVPGRWDGQTRLKFF